MRGRPTPLASLLGGAAYGGPYRHLPEWPSRAPQVTRAWSSSQPHFKTFFCDYLTGAQRIRVSGGKPSLLLSWGSGCPGSCRVQFKVNLKGPGANGGQ